MSPSDEARAVEVELNAVIVAVADEDPRIVTVALPGSGGELEGLPSGPLDPTEDRTLGLGLRRWARERTGIDLGYIEQLYTFGDRDRDPDPARRVLSIAYLALARASDLVGSDAPTWRRWYDYLPWEDWRDGPPDVIADELLPALARWAEDADPELAARRRDRVEISFGDGIMGWDPVRVLDRYELMYEAGLVAESGAEGESSPHRGRPLVLDHRRIVAAALERLRGKLSYRPVVFELVPDAFTLNQLQRVVEALAGQRLHKPNFRRLVEQARLVERTGTLEQRTGGRPAELFRFRRDVVGARPTLGVGFLRRRAR